LSDENPLCAFKSFYGALTCICWSPGENWCAIEKLWTMNVRLQSRAWTDGNHILTGGEDDLVTLYEWRTKTVVARCAGHESFITRIRIDPHAYSNDDDGYRFLSVGQDTQLIFWDYSPDSLIPPRQKVRMARA
jgi:WD40 repeat protein